MAPLGDIAYSQASTVPLTETLAQAGADRCIAQDQLSFVKGQGLRWHRQPAVTILSQSGDSLIKDARDAVDYWNRQLEEMGSGLRLGTIRIVSDIERADEAYAEYLSRFVLDGQRGIPDLPPAKFKAYCGSIVIVLTDGDFISFARPILRYGIDFAGIKGGQHYPFDLPNVPRNVIAHEIGHAIGVNHNADDTMLMCGRPAPCRPDTQFRSSTRRFFPLTDGEKELLRRRYPAGWSGD